MSSDSFDIYNLMLKATLTGNTPSIQRQRSQQGFCKRIKIIEVYCTIISRQEDPQNSAAAQLSSELKHNLDTSLLVAKFRNEQQLFPNITPQQLINSVILIIIQARVRIPLQDFLGMVFVESLKLPQGSQISPFRPLIEVQQY